MPIKLTEKKNMRLLYKNRHKPRKGKQIH